MLDIYLLADDEPTPNSPDGKKRIGGFTLEGYSRLAPFWQQVAGQGIKFEYFSDSRMTSHEVSRLKQDLSGYLLSLGEDGRSKVETEIASCLAALVCADEAECGVVCFCD